MEQQAEHIAATRHDVDPSTILDINCLDAGVYEVVYIGDDAEECAVMVRVG